MSEILQAQYIKRFHCIGPDCEDNCCHMWRVDVDKHTYFKYRKCSDLALRARLDRYVSRNRKSSNDNFYAKIKLEDSGCCHFLSDGLCTLQRTLGEEYLSVICDTYPRLFQSVNGILELALTLSCPEAARIVLLNPQRLEFDVEKNSYSRYMLSRPDFNTEDSRYLSRVERHFWPLRVFVIDLLQNREYLLWQRLVILGFFCQTVNQANPNEIPGIIERYKGWIDQGYFREKFEDIPSRYDVQGELLHSLLQYRLTGNGISPQFIELLEKTKEALNLVSSVDEKVTLKYKEAYENFYRPYMADRKYILENYLVNYAFKSLFPFEGKGIFSSYVIMIVQFAIIKMMLIGLTAYYQEQFSDDHIVKLVYSFSRSIEHHDNFLACISEMFEENGWDNLPYMAVLIRN